MTLTADAPPAPGRPVSQLWYTRCPVPAASGVAIDRDLFARDFGADGIEVASLRASGATAVRESHFDHSQPDSFREGGNIPPLWARSRGADLRLVGLSWADSYQAVIALPGAGIDGAAGLRSRRVGLARRVNDKIDFWRATALHGLEGALGSAGLGLDDVELVDLAVEETYISDLDPSTRGSLFGARSGRRLQAAEVHALVRGEVDAIYVTGARGVDTVAFLDADVVVDLHDLDDRDVRINNITPVALTVSGELLDARPDLVTRYLATTVRAARWAARHEDETRRILAREVGFAEEWIDDAYSSGVHAGLEPSLDDELVRALTVQKDFLLRHGFLAGDVDVEAFVARQPLAEAVRLVDAEAA